MTTYLKKAINIVIIPARGGSKRLPGKNTLPLDSIPLIVHSINYARANNNILDRIIVSTDDAKIKEISIKEGVEVIDRPENLSTDTSNTISVLKHVLETIKEEVENVILLQPTNPLRPENLLTEAFQKYKEINCDSLMTVTRSYQKFGKIENQRFEPFNYEMGQRSQDLDPLYFENGLLYITKASLILNKKILGPNNFPFIVDHPFAGVDIDFREDLDYAEFLLERAKK
ncbi:acylneuraminate cytidylyltransferase family protein [Autumnicola psychrophila]|uniref:Acylneuraminate cytidylyltransferase family protein n=1 Tax=Autumnicola psychrophila TaxID=3075592 RepID=A0ABU3DT07_9FLAO|nr:acylneuraminate cytidylyltransferase family protein [Zunongwangia sp. F225]MDT0686844.1 acylneuraminate cytidylyltransferase family protein [Zunongwangia sp. F225]